MVFNAYSITTPAEADKELTQAIATLEAGLREIDEIGKEMMAIILTMTTSNICLSKVAEVPITRSHYGGREDYTLSQWGAEYRLKDGKWEWDISYNKPGQVVQRFMDLGELLPGKTRAPIRWFGTDDLPTGISEDDAAKYRALWTLAGDLHDAYRGLEDSKAEYKKTQARYLQVVENSKDLIGTYVRAWTSRRKFEGWVVSGRGKTLHIMDDRFSSLNLRRRTMYNEPLYWENLSGVADDVLRAVQWSDRDAESGRFTMGKDGVYIEIIYSKKMAAVWKKTIAGWTEKVKAAQEKAKSELDPMLKWEAEGGLLAVERAKKVRTVTTGPYAKATPEALMSYLYQEVPKMFLQEIIERISQADKEAIRAGVEAKALAAIGGPLTEKEEELLATKPAGPGSDNINVRTKHILMADGPLK